MIDVEDKEYGLEERHKQLYVLLRNFDDFCQKYKIIYSLSYGTMLGAVREHGFIPWDDDADIMMYRDEYEKLLHAFEDDHSFQNKYCIERPLWLSKIREKNNDNIWVDLFVIDYVPQKQFDAIIKRYLLLMLQGMIKPTLSWKGSALEKLLSLFTWIIGKFFTYRFKIRIYDIVSKAGNKNKGKEVSIYNAVYKYLKNFSYDSKLIDSIFYVDFEGSKMPIFKNYDIFLKKTYGDYMKRPPRNEQMPTHSM